MPARHLSNKSALRRRAVRAILLAHGETFGSIAKRFGCTRNVLQQILNDQRPARGGKSLLVRQYVDALLEPSDIP